MERCSRPSEGEIGSHTGLNHMTWASFEGSNLFGLGKTVSWASSNSWADQTATDRQPARPRLTSQIPILDQALQGGFPRGTIVECGMPPTQMGRYLLLPVMRSASHSLWVHSPEIMIHAAAWAAWNINLHRHHFIPAPDHVSALQPLFASGLYPLIIINRPQYLKRPDYAFLRRQAERHGYTLVVIRDHFLSPRQGNPFAGIRLNCWREGDSLNVHILRDGPTTLLKLPISQFRSEILQQGMTAKIQSKEH